jgi:predicted secreted protein
VFALSAASADENSTYNRVSFQVTESRDVENDQITVTMGIERNDQDATRLADEINRLMKWATTTADQFRAVDSTGSDYSIRPIYSRDKHLDHWRGQSSLVLRSKDNKEMARLVQTLQEKMTIKSTVNSVSDELRNKTVTTMTDSALKKFTMRAKQVTASLGYSKYRLVTVNINSSGHMPRPVYSMNMARSSMAAESVAPPAFESGQSTLTITVNGTIEMEVSP